MVQHEQAQEENPEEDDALSVLEIVPIGNYYASEKNDHGDE